MSDHQLSPPHPPCPLSSFHPPGMACGPLLECFRKSSQGNVVIHLESFNVVIHLESFFRGEKLVLQMVITFLEVVVLRSSWLQEDQSPCVL